MFDVLYVCSANVWRSQIAQSLHERTFPNSSCRSAALIEDRRAKYADGLPEAVLASLLERWIDAREKRPKLLSRELCEGAERIVLLLNPYENTSEFDVDGMDAVDFLISEYSGKLSVCPIEDPFGMDSSITKRILVDIETVVLAG